MACPFCSLIELKYHLLEDGDGYVVVLSNPRLMPGHTLVIPKRHIFKPSEMTAQERTSVFNAVLRWQDKITSVLSAGCIIKQNFQPYVSESRLKIDHVHFHLYPREFKDKFYYTVDLNTATLFEPLSEKELETIERIFLK